MTSYAKQVIKEVAAKHGIPVREILGRCRFQPMFRARVEVAQRLHERGGIYNAPRIGKILNRDHTTILYYLGRLKRQPSRPRQRKESACTSSDA